MTTIDLPYGKSSLPLRLDAPFDLYQPIPERQPEDPDRLVQHSLAQPLGIAALERFRGAQSACIAINDKTRPVPYQHLLMPLIDRLNGIGIPDHQIILLVATGTHAPASQNEIETIVPAPLLSRKDIRILSHNCDDSAQLTYLGQTRRKTPVWINSIFYNSDLRIVTGNIEPHHFMGYSGGVKSAAIGLTGRETINSNHAMLGEPHAVMGEFDRNPMRQDVEEIGAMIGVHFALNVLLNSEFELLEVLWGDPRHVMQAGIQRARALWFTPIQDRYDLIIASAGGHPKDINLYQAQKAFTHAALFARPGAAIILAAACPEGIGSPRAEQFARTVHMPAQAIEAFTKSGFQIGPHKVYQLALQAAQNTLFLISEMPSETAAQFFLQPINDLPRAVQAALNRMKPQPRIAVLPHATAMIPVFEPSET